MAPDTRIDETEAVVSEDEMNARLPIDTSKFLPLTLTDVLVVLGMTIKRDETNKGLTFLAQLSAYTDDSQLNVSFNAPSSTGKSFIPTEIAKLFPEEDVIEVAYCSPTAFFHDYGEFSQEKGGYTVNLAHKILIFLDQPHTQLLQHLRPLLSHDKREIRLKITDKSQKAGLRTKNIYLIGFPVVVFCSAGLNLDEQEATRFLLLSPEINQEKIQESISEKIKKESESSMYRHNLETDPERSLLKERIRAIRDEHITEIKLKSPELVKKLFFSRIKSFKPRHQRDIGRVISLAKAIALLNVWYRERVGLAVVANDSDVEEAFRIWDEISQSQELNLPPFVLNFYKDVILEKFKEKNSELHGGVSGGLTRHEILSKHFEVYDRMLPDWQLRQQIIPSLETAGLIYTEADSKDKRRMLIYPTAGLTISKEPNNSESGGGANRCPACGGEDFWERADGGLVCGTCHPCFLGAEEGAHS